MAVAMFAFGRIMEIRPIFEFGALHYGAVTWAETGSHGEYEAYFCNFPSNIGGMLFLKNLYAVAVAAGCRDYCLIATLANILLLVGSAALSVARARRGDPLTPRMAFFGLFLFWLIGEADPRYLLHFRPFLVLSGVMGLTEAKNLLAIWRRRWANWMGRRAN